jgi:hypothetical protein
MDYSGLEVAALLEKNQKAVCVAGNYVGYIITKNEYGDIIWGNGEIVGLGRFYIESKWKIIISI